MGEMFAVLSGKGGTGKTTVCAGIAAALAAEGRKVLCVDCDVGLRNLDISLGMTDSSAISFLDVMDSGYGFSAAAVHPIFPGLRLLTAPMNCPVERIDVHGFSEMLRKAREEFDYVFLDAPAGVDAGFRLVSACAERILVVTNAGPAAVRDASQVGDLLEIAGKKDVRMVVNRVSRSMLSSFHMTIDDVMDNAGLPLMGVVLEDPNIPMAATAGKSILQYAKRSDAAKAFKRIAARIQGFSKPITLR